MHSFAYEFDGRGCYFMNLALERSEPYRFRLRTEFLWQSVKGVTPKRQLSTRKLRMNPEALLAIVRVPGLHI